MATVTLTVVYDTRSSGAWAFSSTDSSVTGVSGTAITVTDGTNYYYYAPATDTLGTSLSGGTWQTVYGLGDGTTSSSPTSSSDGYIQSSGSQYIDTGAYFNSDEDSFSVRYQFAGSSSNKGLLLGGGDYTTTQGEYYIGYPGSSSDVRIVVSKSNSNLQETLYSSYSTTIYTITFSNNVLYLDDTSKFTNTKAIDTQYATTLFVLNRQGTLTSYGYFKIYSYSYSDNGVVKRNFIPIQIGTSGEYALYDISFKDNGNTKVIYHNDGSNSFSGDGTRTALSYTHTVQGSPSVKVYNASTSSWVDGTPYVFNGTSWVQASKVYVYNGTSGEWVEKT